MFLLLRIRTRRTTSTLDPRSLVRRKKCSLFPLTLPKKLGTVGRHNFFFLFQRKLLIFILQTCSFFVIFTLTG